MHLTNQEGALAMTYTKQGASAATVAMSVAMMSASPIRQL